MSDKITIGKYYYGTSLLHQWNPISKLICSLCFIICTFLIEQISVMIVFTTVLILLLFLSEISFGYYTKVVWSTRYFLFFLFLFNCLFQMPITQNVLLLLKLILVILYSTIVLYTTSIRELSDVISVLLHPLSWIRIPVMMISRMIGLSISFLPIVMEQTNHILKALTVRGIDYHNGTLKQKLSIWKMILLPLFISAFRHADAVANTMEVRLYSLELRNYHMRKSSLHFFDIFQLALHILLIILVWKEGMA